MKKYLFIVPLVLIFCFSIACQDKAAMVELEKYKAQGAIEAQNKELVNSFWSAIDKNDFIKLKELTTDDFSIKAPGLAEPMKLEDVFQAIKMLWAGFPDMRYDIKEMVARGDKVIVRFVSGGTHSGEYRASLLQARKLKPAECG